MKIIVAAFVVLYAAAALFLMVVSVHGPDSLPSAAIGYFLLSSAALIVTCVQLERRRHQYAKRLAALLGVALAGAAPLVMFAASAYDEFRYERKISGTHVSGVRDELLHTANGNPIGIRVSYTVRFPLKDHFSVHPFAQPSGDYYRAIHDSMPEGDRSYSHGPLQMRVVGRTIDPLPIEANSDAIARRNLEVPTFGVVFEAGIDYQFTFDLTPRYIRRVEGKPGYCVADSEGMRWRGSPEGYQTLLQGDHAVKYEFWIRNTRYGRLHGEDAWTANEYNPKTFYDGVMAENPRACTSEEALAY